MQYIIDRIENSYAICEDEDRRICSIPLASLPPSVHEGMVLILHGQTYAVDLSATQARQEYMEKKRRELFE